MATRTPAKKPAAPSVAKTRVNRKDEEIDVSTDTAVNQHQHEFSGDVCEIKLFKGEPHEPKEPFFGLNNYQVTLQREKWITVPVELADHIESLTYGVREPDPSDPENPDKFVWADKARFPLQRREVSA